MNTQSTTPSKDLQALASDLHEHADASDISLRDLCKEHPSLGSPQTLKTAMIGGYTDTEAAALLAGFQAAAAAISGGTDDSNTLYEDLSGAKAVRAQFTRLKMSRTNAKLVIIEGNTGMGKTSAGEIIAAKALALNPVTSIYHIEASAGWGDRPNAMLAAMLKALGSPDTSRSQAARLDKLSDALNQRPVVLIVDEAHDMGVRCLRVINCSPTWAGAGCALT